MTNELCARLGITKFMEQAGLVKLEIVRDAGGNLENAYVKVCPHGPRFLHPPDHFPKVDRQNVLENGSKVMGELLLQLQIRKSIADGPGARAYYTDLTTPPTEWLAELRDLVLKKKQVGHLPFSCLRVDGDILGGQ